jgi:hypothetical protein
MPTGNYHKFPNLANLAKIEPKQGHLADMSKNQFAKKLTKEFSGIYQTV